MMKMTNYLQQNPAQEIISVDAVNCFVKVNAQLSFLPELLVHCV